MRHSFTIAALLAATAFTPALAQDDQHERRQQRERREPSDVSRGELRADRPAPGLEGRRETLPEGGWQRRQQQVAPAVELQQQVQVAPQRQWQGNGGGYRGGMRAPGQPQPQQASPAAPGVQAQGREWHRTDGVRAPFNGQSGFAPRDQRWAGERDHRVDNDHRFDGARDRQFDNDHRFDRRGFVDNGRRFEGNRGGDWNRDWRRDQRFDWQRYRYTNRNLFRGNRYDAPYGWNYGYRRFSVGFTLSNLLFDQQYWIDDPYSYRLPPAYGPYRWVRYYDDVLLVDLRSGRVVDAIYDFFW